MSYTSQPHHEVRNYYPRFTEEESKPHDLPHVTQKAQHSDTEPRNPAVLDYTASNLQLKISFCVQ